MRKASSQPFGATRFGMIEVLRELKFYDVRIASHRWESQLLEEEEQARLREEETATRALGVQRILRIVREHLTIIQMTDKQRQAWQWEERIVSWLTGKDQEHVSESPNFLGLIEPTTDARAPKPEEPAK